MAPIKDQSWIRHCESKPKRGLSLCEKQGFIVLLLFFLKEIDETYIAVARKLVYLLDYR